MNKQPQPSSNEKYSKLLNEKYSKLLSDYVKFGIDQDLADIQARRNLGLPETNRDRILLAKEKEIQAEKGRKGTKLALTSPHYSDDDMQITIDESAFSNADPFEYSYTEAIALGEAVNKAEDQRKAKRATEAEKRTLKEIANMSLNELNVLQNNPKIAISDESYKRMLNVINKLKKLERAQQEKELLKMPVNEKYLLRMALRRRAVDERKAELVSNEWSSDLESNIYAEALKEVPVSKINISAENLTKLLMKTLPMELVPNKEKIKELAARPATITDNLTNYLLNTPAVKKMGSKGPVFVDSTVGEIAEKLAA